MKSQKPSALFQFQQSADPLSPQALRPQLARLCLDLESLHNISDLPQLPQKIVSILPICMRQSIFDYGRLTKQASEGVERGSIEPDWMQEWGLEELQGRISWAVNWLKKVEDIQRQRQENQQREQQKEREREREAMLRMEAESSMDQEFSQQISESYSDCQSLGVESVSVDYSACFPVEPELSHECGHSEQQIEKGDTKNQSAKKKKKKKIEKVQEVVEEEDSNTPSFTKRKRN